MNEERTGKCLPRWRYSIFSYGVKFKLLSYNMGNVLDRDTSPVAR